MHTGNNISIPEEELISFVHFSLARYEELVDASGSDPSYSPYSQPIIYTTQDGKQVQIPEEIQQNAIQIWMQQKQQGALQSSPSVQTANSSDLPGINPNQAYEEVNNQVNNNQIPNEFYNQNSNEFHNQNSNEFHNQNSNEFNSQNSNEFNSQDLSELRDEVPDGYQNPLEKKVRFIPNAQEIPQSNTVLESGSNPNNNTPVYIVQKDNNNVMWMALILIGVAITYYMYNKRKTVPFY